MIRFNADGEDYNVAVSQFPAGELKVSIINAPQLPVYGSRVVLQATLQCSDDVMALLLTVDAIRRNFIECSIRLHIPYLAYARQDRVCNPGESLSIYVMAQLINSCNFTGVLISDPHSDVGPALISNCVIETQGEVFGKIRSDWSHIHIVAPDAGAAKKAQRFADAVGAAGVIQCMKKRDLKTGKLGGFVCLDDVEGKHLFVLDDICDGGGTFLGLSEILRPKAAKLELAVTHGIFSKGVQVVADAFDHVYTTNSFTGKLIKANRVTCINTWN